MFLARFICHVDFLAIQFWQIISFANTHNLRQLFHTTERKICSDNCAIIMSLHSAKQQQNPTKSGTPPLPPPPPPPPAAKKASSSLPSPKPPVVTRTGPVGAFLVELLIYNGSPFKDHWAYWVRSHNDSDVGVLIHATGDVRNGFTFEIKRSHDFQATGNRPNTRIPLQWVDEMHFNEKRMFNGGNRKVDTSPVCGFEASVHKVKVPGKTLNAVNDNVSTRPELRCMVLAIQK